MKVDLVSSLVFLGVLSIPFELVLPLPGIKVSAAGLFFTFAFGVWLTTHGDITTVGEGRVFLLPIGFFLVACAISIPAARDISLAAKETIQFVWYWALFFFMMNWLREATTRSVWFLLGLGALASALVGLYQYLYVREPVFNLIADTRFRAIGFYDQPNALGSFFAGVIPMIGGLFWLARSETSQEVGNRVGATRRQMLFAGLMVVAMMGLAATVSRGSWIGVAVGLLLLMVFLFRQLSFRALLIPLVACSFGFGVIHLDLSRAPRYELLELNRDVLMDTNIRSFSNQQRLFLLEAGWKMFRDHPLVGVGLGNFATHLPDFYTDETRVLFQRDFDPDSRQFFINPEKKPHFEIVHNMVLQIACETGIIGLASFLWLFGVLLWRGARNIERAHNLDHRILRACSFAAVAALIVGGMFGWPFSHGVQEVLLLALASTVAPFSGESLR